MLTLKWSSLYSSKIYTKAHGDAPVDMYNVGNIFLPNSYCNALSKMKLQLPSILIKLNKKIWKISDRLIYLFKFCKKKFMAIIECYIKLRDICLNRQDKFNSFRNNSESTSADLTLFTVLYFLKGMEIIKFLHKFQANHCLSSVYLFNSLLMFKCSHKAHIMNSKIKPLE